MYYDLYKLCFVSKWNNLFFVSCLFLGFLSAQAAVEPTSEVQSSGAVSEVTNVRISIGENNIRQLELFSSGFYFDFEVENTGSTVSDAMTVGLYQTSNQNDDPTDGVLVATGQIGNIEPGTFWSGSSLLYVESIPFYSGSYFYSVCEVGRGIESCSNAHEIEMLVAEDGYEFDNQSEFAGNVKPGDVQHRSIYYNGDIDWAIFELDIDATDIVIETTGRWGDTILELYDEDLNRIARNDNGGHLLFSKISLDRLSPGKYYVRVSESGDDEIIDFYTLNLNFEGGVIADYSLKVRVFDVSKKKVKVGEEIEVEAIVRNSGPDTSLPETLNLVYAQGDPSTYETEAPVIYHSVPIPFMLAGGSRRLNFTVTIPNIPLGSYEFGACIEDYGHDSLTGERLCYAHGSDHFADLIKRVWVEVQPSPDEYEDDDLFSTAGGIANGETQMHNFHEFGDKDWLTFSVEDEPTPVVIKTFGRYKGNTVLYLFDSSLNLIANNDDIGSNGINEYSEIRIDSLPAGKYYVLVEEYQNDDLLGEYGIRLKVGFGNGTNIVPEVFQILH